MTITLPTPTIEISGYDRRGRKVIYLISTETSEDGSTSSEAVELSIYHSKDRKQFTATAYRVTIEKDAGSPFTCTKYDNIITSGVRLHSEPVARFSAKAIDAFTTKVIGGFAYTMPTEPKLQALFADRTAEEA